MRALLSLCLVVAALLGAATGKSLAANSADKYEKIVVVGDLHGDMGQCLALLRGTGIVSYQPDYYATKLRDEVRKWVSTGDGTLNKKLNRDDVNAAMIYNKRGHLMAASRADQYHWNAGKTLFVYLGDALDVGPDDMDIVAFFMRLEGEARNAGGKLVYLLGNHEVNNLNNVFTTVHPWSFERSGGRKGREFMLSMETPTGRYLRSRPAIFEYDHLIFMHGGILPETVKAIKERMKPKFDRHHFVQAINDAAREVFEGKKKLEKDSLASLVVDFSYDTNGNTGPLLVHPLKGWEGKCEEVDKALKELGGIQSEVVGHTPHNPPKFWYCHGQLLAVDFHMSQWKGGEDTTYAAIVMKRDTTNPANETWGAELVVPTEQEPLDSEVPKGRMVVDPIGYAVFVLLGVCLCEGILWACKRRFRPDAGAAAPVNAGVAPSYGATGTR